jgi:hypothetical protein
MAMARRAIQGEIAIAAAIAGGAVARGEDATKVKNPWALTEHRPPEMDADENRARHKAYIEARKAGIIR